MRLPQVENYKNDSIIERKRIIEVPPIKRHIALMSDRDKVKFIKTVERVVRSSMEYKQYVAYLKKEIDMTMCSFFTGVSSKDARKVSIEIHHEPFTLFDITQTVLQKHIEEGIDINPILIAEEVMKLHYQNKVGLIPLSITVHELFHMGKVFIPLQNVYGRFDQFLEEYDDYISDDLKDVLEMKLVMSKDVASQDLSILEKKFTYLEIDGMTFPQVIGDIYKK